VRRQLSRQGASRPCLRIVRAVFAVHPLPAPWSQPGRSRSRIFSQVPPAGQRRCRLYTVFQFPNRSGRSRLGQPTRVRKKDPVHHQPVIIPPVPLTSMSWQQRLQPSPLRIRLVMPLQPLIVHGTTPAETTAKIYETRPGPPA
jgi:hypothetical protein